MRFEILYGPTGWGRTFIEAESEDEAEEIFEDGDWTPDKEDFGYEIASIRQERI